MGACETTPTTTRDPGNQPSDLRTRQPAGTPQAVPPQPGDQVTGSIQHCLLTTKAPMGADIERARRDSNPQPSDP